MERWICTNEEFYLKSSNDFPETINKRTSNKASQSISYVNIQIVCAITLDTELNDYNPLSREIDISIALSSQKIKESVQISRNIQVYIHFSFGMI